MMMLAAWNTLDEVAAYLLDRTGEPWTARAVLERLSDLKPETVTICPPVGTPFLILKDGRWENWTYSHPMLFEVGGGHLDSCLHQWLISNSAGHIQMVRGNDRFQIVAQIPMEWVRIRRSDVDMLPTAFHQLVDGMKRGQHPKLRGALDSSDTNDQFSDIPQQRAESATNERAKRKRVDAMRALLEELVPKMERQGKTIGASTVMAELKRLDDPCILDTKPDGVVWERASGRPTTLKLKGLYLRLQRMGFVGQNARR